MHDYARHALLALEIGDRKEAELSLLDEPEARDLVALGFAVVATKGTAAAIAAAVTADSVQPRWPWPVL